MNCPKSKYGLNRRFILTLRRRRGVTVSDCAKAMNYSVSTWYNRERRAALGDDRAKAEVIYSIEKAHTPPQPTPLEHALTNEGRCF